MDNAAGQHMYRVSGCLSRVERVQDCRVHCRVGSSVGLPDGTCVVTSGFAPRPVKAFTHTASRTATQPWGCLLPVPDAKWRLEPLITKQNQAAASTGRQQSRALHLTTAACQLCSRARDGVTMMILSLSSYPPAALLARAGFTPKMLDPQLQYPPTPLG